ncbi:MAG: hypothetical protein ACE37K_14745 [Planctomycetota bacterium]
MTQSQTPLPLLRDASGGALPTTNDAVMVVGTPGNWSFPVREGEPIAIPPSANGTWVAGNVTGTTNVNANGQLLFNQSADDGTGSTSTGGAFSGSAGSPIWFDHAGDFVFRQSIDNNVEAAIVKVQAACWRRRRAPSPRRTEAPRRLRSTRARRTPETSTPSSARPAAPRPAPSCRSAR